jgi:beta-1,4-mannosyl-glycoprotein beta-1,4-N-acetylglucosaminyltransferase
MRTVGGTSGAQSLRLMQTWDCFLFNDEIDLLRFRLRELDSVVDRVVIAEGDRMHQGQPKSSQFEAHAGAFAPWQHKIIYIRVALPDIGEAEAYERERLQHAAFAGPLANAAPDDLVLVGDVDEIPTPDVVNELRLTLQRPTRLVLRHAVYRANFEVPVPWRGGTKAFRASDMEDDELDVLLGRRPGPYRPGMPPDIDRALADGGGWHFSYLGGSSAIQRKLSVFAHDDWSPALREQAHLDACVRLGVDLHGTHLYRRLREQDLDDQQRRLFYELPHLFDFSLQGSHARRLGYRAWARYRRALPTRARALAERHTTLLLPVLTVPLALVDVLERTAVRHRLRSRARRLAQAVRLRLRW